MKKRKKPLARKRTKAEKKRSVERCDKCGSRLDGVSTMELKREMAAREDNNISELYKNDGAEMRAIEKEVEKLIDGVRLTADMGSFTIGYELRWNEGEACDICDADVIRSGKSNIDRWIADKVGNVLYSDDWEIADLQVVKKQMAEMNKRITAIVRRVDKLSAKYDVDVFGDILDAPVDF